MIARTDRDEAIVARVQHVERRIEGVAAGEPEIGFLVAHERGHEARDAVANLERRARHVAAKRLDQFGQHARRESRQAREPHRAARAFAERACIAQHALHVVERALQQRQQLAARLRQRDAAAVAVEQPRADDFLEPPDLHGQRRLRQMQPRGRAREVAGLRDGDERANVAKIQIHNGS